MVNGYGSCQGVSADRRRVCRSDRLMGEYVVVGKA